MLVFQFASLPVCVRVVCVKGVHDRCLQLLSTVTQAKPRARKVEKVRQMEGVLFRRRTTSKPGKKKKDKVDSMQLYDESTRRSFSDFGCNDVIPLFWRLVAQSTEMIGNS